MRTNLSLAARNAIDVGGTSAAEAEPAVKSDGDWFSQTCRALLPHKAGTALHYTTGVDERLCQKYAAGSVKPPAYFLRALLRSDGGWQWLASLMEDSDSGWWRDLQRARRVVSQLDAIDMG